MLKREKGSEITDEFLESFGKLYHSFKYFGITPTDICMIFTKILNVSKSSYYTYLRLSREKGYVSDTEQQNREELNKRMKGEGPVIDTGVKTLIFDQINSQAKTETK